MFSVDIINHVYVLFPATFLLLYIPSPIIHIGYVCACVRVHACLCVLVFICYCEQELVI